MAAGATAPTACFSSRSGTTAAYDAHVMADHTRALRAKLLPFQGALYDERLYNVVR